MRIVETPVAMGVMADLVALTMTKAAQITGKDLEVEVMEIVRAGLTAGPTLKVPVKTAAKRH